MSSSIYFADAPQAFSCSEWSQNSVLFIGSSSFFPATVSGTDIHGAYFTQAGTIELMRQILRGIDRGVLATTGQLVGGQWPK